jgi:hypothetical protein
MLAVSLRRSVLNQAQAAKSCNFRSVSSIPSGSSNNNKKEEESVRRKIHNTSRSEQDVAQAISPSKTETFSKIKSSTMIDRFVVTAEVTISKIFPAGFCWQTASVVAGNQGYSPDSLNFALITGFGDALGVFAGHCLYYAGKKSVQGESSHINMTKEMQNGLLLGTAAFCSGTVWQPIVNALQGANLPFNQVFLGTWAGCGAAFYVGLRVGRTVLSGPCRHIEEPTYENGKNDAALSTAVGGATGFFVGTDAAYLPNQNFLIDFVGIQPGVPDLMGCAIAGTSTSLGFLTAQSTMNLAYPSGKCWND